MQEFTLVPFSFWLRHTSGTAGSAGEAGATGQPSPSSGGRARDRYGERDRSAGAAEPSAGPAGHRGPDHDPAPAGWQADPPDAASLRLPPTLAGLQRAMAEELKALGHAGAEPLRWAITGVDPERGLRLEGIGLSRRSAPADQPEAPVMNSAPAPQAGSDALAGEQT